MAHKLIYVTCFLVQKETISAHKHNQARTTGGKYDQSSGGFLPCVSSFLRVLMDLLHGLGSIAHVLQDLRVGVRVLQSFPLKLDGGERAINLGELLLQTLFPLQGLQGSWHREDTEVTCAVKFPKVSCVLKKNKNKQRNKQKKKDRVPPFHRVTFIFSQQPMQLRQQSMPPRAVGAALREGTFNKKLLLFYLLETCCIFRHCQWHTEDNHCEGSIHSCVTVHLRVV